MIGFLLRLARIAGDVSAASRGPAVLGKRLVRRSAFRASTRATRLLLRMVGL